MVSPAASSKGWLVGLIQPTIKLPLTPGRLMLFASTTLLLRPFISSSGAWLCDVKRQESVTSVRGSLPDCLHTARHQPSKPVSADLLKFSNSHDELVQIHSTLMSGQKRLAQDGIFIYLAHHEDFFQLSISDSVSAPLHRRGV